MANPNHTSPTPHDTHIPTNPLSRPYWTLAEADFGQRDAATLAGLTTAIRALARVLTNSEAFRDLHAHSQSDTIEPGCSPLDAPTTEGLFAALYFLSEQAETLSQFPRHSGLPRQRVPLSIKHTTSPGGRIEAARSTRTSRN